MPKRRTVESFFRSLGNELRLDILRCLEKGEMNVTELIEMLGKPQSNISHCLKRLENDGLVGVRKKTRFHYYFLKTQALKPVLRIVDAQLGEDQEALKKLQNALEESEARFRIAAFCASDLIYEWDIQADRQTWYGDVAAYLGGAAGKAPKTQAEWLRKIHEADRGRVMSAASVALKDGTTFSEVYRFKREDGSYVTWFERAKTMPGPDGTPRKWIGAVKVC